MWSRIELDYIVQHNKSYLILDMTSWPNVRIATYNTHGVDAIECQNWTSILNKYKLEEMNDCLVLKHLNGPKIIIHSTEKTWSLVSQAKKQNDDPGSEQLILEKDCEIQVSIGYGMEHIKIPFQINLPLGEIKPSGNAEHILF